MYLKVFVTVEVASWCFKAVNYVLDAKIILKALFQDVKFDCISILTNLRTGNEKKKVKTIYN